jgi:hypothetical protein
MVARQICDFCGEPWPRHTINLTRTPNGDPLAVEICGVCLRDFAAYINELLKKPAS